MQMFVEKKDKDCCPCHRDELNTHVITDYKEVSARKCLL